MSHADHYCAARRKRSVQSSPASSSSSRAMMRLPRKCSTKRVCSRSVSTETRAARHTTNSSSKSTITAASNSHEQKTESWCSPCVRGSSQLGPSPLGAPLPVSGSRRPSFVASSAPLASGRDADEQLGVVTSGSVAGSDDAATPQLREDGAGECQQLAGSEVLEVHRSEYLRASADPDAGSGTGSLAS